MKQEVIIEVKADMTKLLGAFDVMIDELALTRDRLRERLASIASVQSNEEIATKEGA